MRKRAALFVTAVLLLWAGPVRAQMVFGLVPEGNSLMRSEEDAALFCAYLEDRLDDRITVRTATEEGALLRALRRDGMHLAVVSNLFYREHAKDLVLVANFTRSESPTQKLLLLVSRGGSVRSLRGLRKAGGRLVLDEQSLSRTAFLTETLGGDPGKLFRNISVSPQVVDALSGVVHGTYDAACVEDGLLATVQRFDPGLVHQVRILKSSQPYASDPIVAGKGLSSGVVGRIRAVLTEMDADSDGQQILLGLRITRFVSPRIDLALYPTRVDPERYRRSAPVREEMSPPPKAAVPPPVPAAEAPAQDLPEAPAETGAPAPTAAVPETAPAVPVQPAAEVAVEAPPAPVAETKAPEEQGDRDMPSAEKVSREARSVEGTSGDQRRGLRGHYALAALGGVLLITLLGFLVLFLVLRPRRAREEEPQETIPAAAAGDAEPETPGSRGEPPPGLGEAAEKESVSSGRFGVPKKTPLVELRGELKTIRVPDLLQLMASCKNTGTLLIQSKHDEKSLYFRDGKICSASCLDKDNKNKLGSLLIKLGKITERERARALALCAEDPSIRLGRALVDIGAVNRNDLREALRIQAQEIVYSMFVFPEGRFEFIKKEPDIDPEEDLSLDVMNLLMEGARREDEWQNMRQAIPSMEIILDFAEGGRERLNGDALTRDQSLTLSLINGERSIREICVRSTLVDFDVCEFLYRLMKLSVLRKVDPTEAAKKRAQAGEVGRR